MPLPTFTTLPLELILQITSYLSGPDYKAIRLVCRYFDASLFQKFAQKYFTAARFKPIEYSLRALVDISESRLSPYLKHVAIGLDILPEPSPWTLSRFWLGMDRVMEKKDIMTRRAAHNKCRQLAADQTAFLDDGGIQRMLVKAFRNLKSLDEVLICQSFGFCKFRFIRNELPYDHSPCEDLVSEWIYTYRPSSRYVQSVLSALGESGAKPRRLDIFVPDADIRDEAFNIPSFVEGTMQPMISNLEAIKIETPLDSRADTLHKSRLRSNIDTHSLRRLLSSATNLKSLSLCLTLPFRMRSSDSPNQVDDSFLEWLGASVSCGDYVGLPRVDSPRPPAFLKLHELRLRGCKIRVDSLLDIIEKCSNTLRNLCLYNITLQENRLNRYVRFIKSLAMVATHLEAVSFHYFADGVVQFSKKDGSGKPCDEFFYEGPNIEEELETLKLTVSPENMKFPSYITYRAFNPYF